MTQFEEFLCQVCTTKPLCLQFLFKAQKNIFQILYPNSSSCLCCDRVKRKNKIGNGLTLIIKLMGCCYIYFSHYMNIFMWVLLNPRSFSYNSLQCTVVVIRQDSSLQSPLQYFLSRCLAPQSNQNWRRKRSRCSKNHETIPFVFVYERQLRAFMYAVNIISEIDICAHTCTMSLLALLYIWLAFNLKSSIRIKTRM